MLLVVLGIGAMLALWIGAIRLVGSLDSGVQLLLFAVVAWVMLVRLGAALFSLLDWMVFGGD